MGKNHDIVTLDITARHQTEKAVLVENLKGAKVWIPKSQCEYEDGSLQLPEWLAVEKDLI